METYGFPYELILYGWALGLAFHTTLHFIVKGWTSFRLFAFWSGPKS